MSRTGGWPRWLVLTVALALVALAYLPGLRGPFVFEHEVAALRAAGYEAAVALGLLSSDEVVYALSQQFHYPYTPSDRGNIHPELITASQPFGFQAEAFRAIRSQLIMRVFNPKEPRRALAVISPDGGDGKTYFVANLGVVLAQLGGRTLLQFNLYLAARNLPHVDVRDVQGSDPVSLIAYDKVLITVSAVKKFEELLA